MPLFTTALTERYVALMEGEADNIFLQKLITARGLPSFAFPFPPKHEVEVGTKYYGRDAFVHMLAALSAFFELNDEARERTKGILVVADATDKPGECFRYIRDQIARVGTFGIPETVQSLAVSPAGSPPLLVLQIPCDGRPGGLETLCLAALAESHPDQAACLTTFFDCCNVRANEWGHEKYDKARLQCLVGVTYKPNPTRGMVQMFKRYKGRPPAIDIKSASFNPIAAAVGEFVAAVG